MDLFRSPNRGSWGFPLESTEFELFNDFKFELAWGPAAAPPGPNSDGHPALELCSGIIREEFEVKPGDFKEGGGDFKQVDCTDKE